jgi:hypothetical protein
VVQLRYEQKVFWRHIGAAFFTFAFPVLLFVLAGALLGSHGETALGGTPGIQYYTPAIAAYGVMSACFVSVALTVTFRHETGLAASAVINAAVIVTLIITVGAAGYGATLPRRRHRRLGRPQPGHRPELLPLGHTAELTPKAQYSTPA